MSNFIADNRITFEGMFSALHLTPATENDGGNSDRFRLTFNTADNGGQELEQGGRELAFISFTIVGTQEMHEFVELLNYAYDQMYRGVKNER